MRITVEIDESVLNDLVAMMGETKKSPAVAKAVTEFYRRAKAREFGKKLREGYFNYPTVNEEIEKYDR